MRWQDLQQALREQPFEPFRIRLTTGPSYDVRHPEFAMLTRYAIHVGIQNDGNGDAPDRVVKCDLLHVVAIEPIDEP